MEMYLLKSAACLALLMIFYKFLLEKENMHNFKRWYLLAAVIVSFVIPWITFTTYSEPVAAESMVILQSDLAPETIPQEKFLNLSFLLWSLYGIGVLFFGIKFILNLRIILLRINRNPKIHLEKTTNVLLQEKLAPHTFWDYIFLNKDKYEKKEIPKEVFQHEQAHALQRHSADIIFMELLQIVFWFHPLLYMVSRAIRLNHEFLADRAVLKEGIQPALYQKTLLAFSSNAFDSNLVNPINYQSIKKRFTVMKTKTSKNAIWTKSLLLLPVLALMLYSFSSKEVIPKETRNLHIAPVEKSKLQFGEETDSVTVKTYEVITVQIQKDGSLLINNNPATLENLALDLEKKQRAGTKISRAYIETFPEASQEIITDVKKIITESGISETYLGIKGERIYSKTLDNDISKGLGKIDQEKATPQMITEYNNLVKHYNSEDNSIIKNEDLQRMNYIYSIMTPQQREKAEKRKFKVPPVRTDEKPAGSKKSNRLIFEADTLIFREDDSKVKSLNFRAGSMKFTESSVPPPPPPPAPPVTKDGDVPPPPPAPPVAKDGNVPPPPAPPVEVIGYPATPSPPSEVNENSTPQPPPVEVLGYPSPQDTPPAPTVNNADNIPAPPPPPLSPVEAVENWIKEAAEIFYNGKKITGQQAREIVQENNGKNLSVQVVENNSGKTVRISDKKR